MAEKAEHSFERIPIDHTPWERRVSSSLAALSLHNGDDRLAGKSTVHDLKTTGRGGEGVGDAAVEDGWEEVRLKDTEQEPGAESLESLESRESGKSGVDGPRPGDRRKASISFATEVTSSDGGRGVLRETPPKSGAIQIPMASPSSDGVADEDWQNNAQDETVTCSSSKFLDRRNEASLYVAVDAKATGRKDSHSPVRKSGHERLASLPAAIESPSELEAPMTPPYGMIQPNSAPADDLPPLSPFWPTRRSDSQRSRSYQRLDKVATGNRRRSTRSANSSISPASAFLAQWSSRSQTVEEEPDDEGQEIAASGWIIGRAIGYGGFSTVKEVSTMNSTTGKRVVRAVKILRKKPKNVRDETQNERLQSEFEHEVALWRFLRHRYIVPLIAVYDTPFATFCITRLNVGGTLHDLIRSRRQQYNESERGLPAHLAKRYAYQLACALRYLHEDMRIVHRDVKLENCLLDMSAPDASTQGGNILLCDFGMADYMHASFSLQAHPHSQTLGPASSSSNLLASSSSSSTSDMHRANPTLAPSQPTSDLANRDTTLTLMGSLEYASPELLASPTPLFTPSTDIWALGVTVYTLLTGSLPFTHALREKLVLLIEKSQWDIRPLFEAPAVRKGGLAGMAAVETVKGCLTFGEAERWSIADVLGGRWMWGCREVYGDGCFEEGEEGASEWAT